MIIACPACQTRYVVPDSAIGIEGRTVRCAKCKHSWFQDGPGVEAIAASEAVPMPPQQPASPPAATPAPSRQPPPAPKAPPPSEAAPIPKPMFADDPREEAPPVLRDGPDFDETDPPYGDVQDDLPPPPRPELADDVSRFDHAPPFRPRRNLVKLWSWAAAIFALLALGTMAAVNYAGMPAWVPMAKPLFGASQPDLKLEFPVADQERRTLPNGTEFFGARILVTNTARETRNVPGILIVLRDQRERQVYSWVVTPQQRTLTPGETMTINEAVTDVPKSAVFADIGWAPR
ncbi:MJ0042-type zinc finger domain-containing protein [Qipengyuania marisflavi]|uniref:Thioredoxin n=1 Tax=Qipengyuania marisflavi TaxID=2486356 RepID=A0A5S3P028_9SPHN|nr:MJ0042-type zinc finger domain-containing protein [Qipengyuania marisflavi]TMM45879.1 thioredoxin [Qipengyuania marisflavi]